MSKDSETGGDQQKAASCNNQCGKALCEGGELFPSFVAAYFFCKFSLLGEVGGQVDHVVHSVGSFSFFYIITKTLSNKPDFEKRILRI
jgi:hypothetical protein